MKVNKGGMQCGQTKHHKEDANIGKINPAMYTAAEFSGMRGG